jgi:hypothetical protein
MAFYMAMPPVIEQPMPTSDLRHISNNIENELPLSLAMGFNESAAASHLANLTGFMSGVMARRNVNFTCLWVVAFPQEPSAPDGSDANVTVGNWMDHAMQVNVTLSNSTWSSSEIITTSSGTSSSVLFSGAPSSFNATIKFNSIEKKVSMHKNKAGLYAYFVLARAGEKNIREVLA